ncbi:hypothetical protein HHUSO_G31838 [Huso huso]|uniref:Uncharacterized protein n=1 Tax=Huso huso TaxID=61971 RepID=A0ABR0YAF1_HUSHU
MLHSRVLYQAPFTRVSHQAPFTRVLYHAPFTRVLHQTPFHKGIIPCSIHMEVLWSKILSYNNRKPKLSVNECIQHF